MLIRIFEDQLTPEGQFLLEEEVVKKGQENHHTQSGNWLKAYPLSGRLSEVFNSDLKERTGYAIK
ncbi:hypothetical protein CS542_08555 [Pedobacter sp. IW39]|nr:hypothetical protein CS542_08555 [Pedobacter sp. IW39]